MPTRRRASADIGVREEQELEAREVERGWVWVLRGACGEVERDVAGAGV